MIPPSPTGLEAVFLEHRARLLRFLAAHGAGDSAEDLLQELWLKLSAGVTGPIAQPSAYLYRAANNLMIDRARSRQQAGRRDRDWSEVAGGAGERSDAPAADRMLAARETLTAAQAALDALGERTAAIFRRHRLDGLPQRDIAREFGVSISTVESDLRRAYAAMIAFRRSLDEE